MSLRIRAARVAPNSRLARSLHLCPDDFHSPEVEIDEDKYLVGPVPFGEGMSASYSKCPTCGFATMRALSWWQVPGFELREAMARWQCKRHGHEIRYLTGNGSEGEEITIPVGCRCGASEPSR